MGVQAQGRMRDEVFFPWRIELWRGNDILNATRHSSAGSAAIELEVCKERVKRGEATKIIERFIGRLDEPAYVKSYMP